MNNPTIEDILSQICFYLHSIDSEPKLHNLVDMVKQLENDKDTYKLLKECKELRDNVIAFKVREVNKRITGNNKMIASVRLSGQGVKFELACLEGLYVQSSQLQNKLTTYRRLDLLLLTVISLLNDKSKNKGEQ